MNQDIKLNLAVGEQQIVKDELEPREAPIFSAKTVSNLGTWLEVATYGLAEAEKPRIYAEIKEHFASSMEYHQQLGNDVEIARSHALKDLGSAQIANKKYARVYFTCQDEYHIANLLGRSWWTLPLFYFQLIGALVVLPAMLLSSENIHDISQSYQTGLGIAVFNSLYFIAGFLSLFYETKVKAFFKNRFSKNYILASQIFMIWLVIPIIESTIRSVISLKMPTQANPFSLWTMIQIGFVALLMWDWLRIQIAIARKSIRRIQS